MNLCFLCNEYPPGPHGGIGTFTQVMARALVRAGHAVRVVGVYPPSYPAPDEEDDQGVRIWRLRVPAHRYGWIRARYRLYRIVAAWGRAGQIDLVECPDWEGWIAGWPRLPVPVIVRLHGSSSYFLAEMGRPAKRIAFWLEQAALRRADLWCSVSRYTADKTRQLFHLHTAPTAVLYNAVELPTQESAPARSRNRVVFAGTITVKKGVVSLIDAWPKVVARQEHAELHLYGKDSAMIDGRSTRDYLVSQLDEGIKDSVIFHGHVTRGEVLDAFATARVAALPSFSEAFAFTPLEAMACGCPTIFSLCGSGPELIDHNRHGLLVDPDRVDDLAEAIVRVLSDDGLADRLSYAGRERITERFSLPHIVAENETFYRQCLDTFQASR